MEKNKSQIILEHHFHISPDEIDEFMETLQDLNLLNKEGLEVRQELWEKTTKGIDKEKTKIQRVWDILSDDSKKYIIENISMVQNLRVKKFLDSKITNE